MDESLIWGRLPEESNRWFTRFERFRLAGPGRSLLGACNQERVGRGRKESNQVPGSWRNKAKEFNWVQRAEAWDQYRTDQIEAEWQAEIMGPTEVLARLSREGRANPYDFFIKKLVPFQTIDGEVVRDKEGNLLMIEQWDLNDEMLKTHGHLIKSISWTANGRPKIELYSSQDAKVNVGKHHKLFTDRTELTLPDGARIQVTDERYNRSIFALASALGESLSGAGAESPGPVAAAEQAPMGGISLEGG